MSVPTLINPQGVLNSGNTVLLAAYYNNTVYAFTSNGEFTDIAMIAPTVTVVPFVMTAMGDSVILTNGTGS